jgi:HSP20 family protein
MYYNRSNFAAMPRIVGGLMEDILSNGFKAFHDDNREYVSIPVNVKETDKSYELSVIAPGLSKEDFKLNLDKNVLTITFDKKDEDKQENEKWIRSEYHFRSFKRSFTLSEKIDQAGINAKYENGILSISLPKKEAAEPTTQEIKIA